jgi:hypothetical protein
MPCVPGGCACDAGVWICTDDCASVCVPDAPLVPAASPWGIVLLALLVLCGGTGLILWRRHP